MDASVLDRLLMDRALGGLPDDVTALLDEYLQRNVGASRRADQFAAAADLARQALTVRCAPVLPPLPTVALAKIQRLHRRLRTMRTAASLAACLLLGVGVGAWLRSTPERPAGLAGITLPHPQPAVMERSAPGPDADAFWSTKRLYEEWRTQKRTGSPRLEWNSPIQRPRLGGTT